MEGDSRGYIEKTKEQTSGLEHDDSTIFQPSWVRYNSILVDRDDWKSLVRQSRYVFYCGLILWTIHLVSMAFS